MRARPTIVERFDQIGDDCLTRRPVKKADLIHRERIARTAPDRTRWAPYAKLARAWRLVLQYLRLASVGPPAYRVDRIPQKSIASLMAPRTAVFTVVALGATVMTDAIRSLPGVHAAAFAQFDVGK